MLIIIQGNVASPGKQAAETIAQLLCDKENLSYNDINKCDTIEPPKVKRMRFSPESSFIRSNTKASKPRVLKLFIIL